MPPFTLLLLFLFMFCTLAVLLVGVGAMVAGGEFNKKHGNKLMVLRVCCQGLALLMLALMFLFR